MTKAVLELRNVSKSYPATGDRRAGLVQVLRGVNLALYAGQTVALTGPSGSGKSTLLHLAGLLDKPSEGEVVVAGKSAAGLGDAGRTRLRRDAIGFVYQFHHLLPECSALENIMMPRLLAGVSATTARVEATEWLNRVGLSARADHRPSELSGGEQQRVAIARALANQPAILLADEPTGSLDSATAADIVTLIRTLCHQRQTAALIVTHNLDLANQLDRHERLADGQLV
ncbi:MAG: ABC transporter ATP-binding protein [Holosporaceae bacterium]|jgi:lipoprotein-releasing system ATP-binding protein